MLRALPVPDPDELVTVRSSEPGGRPRTDFPTWQFTALREDTAAFSAIAAISVFDRSNVMLSGPGGRGPATDSGRVRVAIVSGNYFPMFGVGAARGRALAPDDDRVPDGHPVAVISHDYWQRTAVGADAVFDRAVSINGTAFTIVGIMPRDFTGDWPGRPID